MDVVKAINNGEKSGIITTITWIAVPIAIVAIICWICNAKRKTCKKDCVEGTRYEDTSHLDEENGGMRSSTDEIL